MSVAKIIEISSRSEKSFEDAIATGVTKAGDSVRGVQEAWIKEMKAQVTDGKVTSFQVDMKVTFVVD